MENTFNSATEQVNNVLQPNTELSWDQLLAAVLIKFGGSLKMELTDLQAVMDPNNPIKGINSTQDPMTLSVTFTVQK